MKKTLQTIHQLLCFVGHPVHKIRSMYFQSICFITTSLTITITITITCVQLEYARIAGSITISITITITCVQLEYARQIRRYLEDIYLKHPALTRVSSIRFLLFEIKRVLVYNSTILYLTHFFVLYFFLQNAYADKKVFENKD